MLRLLQIVLFTAFTLYADGSLCPYQWQQRGQSCYFFSSSNSTHYWVIARDGCLDMGADLVSIDDTAERDWVISQASRMVTQKHLRHDWWIGVNKRMDARTWTGPDGTTARTLDVLAGKWMANQPRVDPNYQCVELLDTKFTVDRCTSSHQTICERPVGEPLTCDSGWNFYGGSCYRHFASGVPYTSAKTACERYGGSLPIIWDIQTQTNVYDWAKQVNQNIWVGLQTTQVGNNYVFDWSNGTTLTSPTYWRSRPSRPQANQCVELQKTSGITNSWSVLPCNQRRQYTCIKPEGSCPQGWLHLLSTCYNIYTGQSRLAFNDAKTFCKNLTSGASMALMYNPDVVNFLSPYMVNSQADGVDQIWIGITDNNSTQWRWVNNGGVGWQNWIHNPPPNTPNKQDCAYADANDPQSKWQVTSDCDTPKNFICQVPVNRVINTATPAPPVHYTCPRGYFLYTNSCIQLNVLDKSWAAARADCQTTNGRDLVRITDNEFSNFISSKVRTRMGNYWIGLHDRQQENYFQWLEDPTNATFTNWHRGEPNNFHGDENCAYINARANLEWNDGNCGSRMHYICQMPASVASEGPTPSTPKPWSVNCGEFWDDDPNSYSCYMFNTDRMSWSDARSSCQARGGDLLSINSLEEEFYVYGRISTLGQNFFWIGANDRATETGWQWSDGSPMGFVNWKAGEPHNQGNEDCIAVSTADGRWTDFQCGGRYGYICEKMGKSTPATTPRPTTPSNVPAGKVWGCPRGWSGFQGQCYQLVRARTAVFDDARRSCGQMAASLVSIHSAAENNFVFSLLPQRGVTGPGNTWIGFTDALRENSFAWVDGTAVTFTKWGLNQPDNHYSADCTVMYHASGLWADVPCTNNPGNFICKRPMGLQDQADIQLAQGCNQGGLGFQAQCYLYVDSGKNWQAAQNDCRRRHGNLATVNNQQIQAFVSAFLVYRQGAGYWIGLKNINSSSNSYTWVSGYGVDYTSWSANHTGNERGTCVGMETGRPVGLWHNFPCTKSLPYICEYPRQGYTTVPIPSTTTPNMACPDGWQTYQSQCIKSFNFTRDQRLSWMDSRSYCRNLGGDLISIHSKAMEDWIYQNVLHNVSNSLWWIGLNDRDAETGHIWSDGTGLEYTNWNQGEPNDWGGREDCVEWVLPDNNWNDNVCDLALNFICSVPRGTQITTAATPATGVPSTLCLNSTWLYYSGFCYWLSPQSGPDAEKTWYDAQRTCNQFGGDLASVQTPVENSFLIYAMSRHSRWSFWLGLNDLDGSYKWADGSPLTFINWQPNQPDDAFGGESCVESTERGDWNDNNCQDKKAYICKQLPGQATPKQPTIPTPTGGCPVGFRSLPILDRCYRVAGLGNNDTFKNFTDAITACQALSLTGSLVSIHNGIQQRYLMTLTAGLGRNVWIGLNDIKRRNYFEWQDNSEVDFTHWGPNQPDENLQSNDPSDRRDCVFMNTNPQWAGNWNDQTCGNKMSYICQTPRVPGAPTLSPDVTGCTVSGYTNHHGICYKYYDTPKSWQDAQNQCQQDGGNLATAYDRFSRNVIALLRMPDIPHANNHSEIWLGLRFDAASRRYQWVGGWPVTFTQWASGEPDQTGNCVKMDKMGNWHDLACTGTYPFVCQINTGTPPPTTSTAHGTCPDNTWSALGEYCYQLVTDRPRSFHDSRYSCQLQGAKLASVHSQQEMNFVFGLFQKATSAGVDSSIDVWLGLGKGFNGAGFAWTDGTEMEFENWGDGEPSDTNNSAHQDCVQAAMANGAWNDVDCFDSNYYVCKALKQVRITTQQYRPDTQGPQSGTQNPTNQPTQNPPNPGTNQPPNQRTVRPPNQGTVRPPNQGTQTQRPPNQGTVNPPNQGTMNPPNQGTANPPNQQQQGNAAQQTGSGSGGQSSGSSGGSSLSGGAIAGIVIGTVAVLAITGVAVYYIRSKNLANQSLYSGMDGFDNALYSKGEDKAEGRGASISFGHGDHSPA